MSKLLRETFLDKSIRSNLETLTSETGFLETFVAKVETQLDFRNANIKLRSSPAYTYKCLNKVHEAPKYKGKIIFPIIETIIIDKGQINYWIFTEETAGYVLKKNSNKLVKDYVLRYFVGTALQKIIENGRKQDKKVDRIMEDIHRFVILSDQNYNQKKEFIGEFEYLEDFDRLHFIYLKFLGNVEKMVNVFDLFTLLGDANKSANLLLIQNFVNVDKSKTLYCRFQRKDLLGPKKFLLYTKIPNSDGDLVAEGSAARSSFGHHPQRSQNFSHSGSNFINSNVNHHTNNSTNNNNNFNNSPSNNNLNAPNFQVNNSNNNLNLNGSGTNFNPFNNNNNQVNNVNNTTSHKITHSKSNNTLGNAVAKRPAPLKKRTIAQVDEEEEEKVKKQIDLAELIPLNDQNLCEYMASICEPFVDLLEKSLGIALHEAILMFHKDLNGTFFFRLCDNILCKSRRTPDEIEQEQRMRENMKSIFEKAIPKEIRKNVRKYEKVSKNAFCFGEFCNFNIPKFFKNMNKFNKDDLNEYKNIDSKLIERNKNHDYAFILPYFIIKKAYDNENLVNIVLKAYSIFPKNFDRDQVLLQLQREKQLEEERKEEENKREAERLKMEEKIKRMGTAATNSEEVKNFLMNEKKVKNSATIKANLGSNVADSVNANSSCATKTPPLTGTMKRNTSASNTEKKKSNLDYKTLEKNILSQDIDDSEEEEIQKTEENKSGVTLYTPTPGKFLNFNFDKMYSKTHVCGNCNIIYMLIEDFLSNFEDGETQFKSLNKAKNLLLQGEKLRNPFNMGDNIDVDENNDNLLFREEKTAFSLKKILRKKIREERYNEMMKNKPFVHQKLYKKVVTKKDEFKKQFDYNIKMNPKLLQLNLLAEKSKNKFFNLILNELKNDPKSLNEKMGMQKPKRGFPKSLESLRMHMGINSKIMVNSEYRALMNLNSAKQRSGSKDPSDVYSEKLGGFRKNSNEAKGNLTLGSILSPNVNNAGSSVNSLDVNIFQEYMKIKLNYKPEIKRLKSQMFDSNQLKSSAVFKKKRTLNKQEEMSPLEFALLKKRKGTNDLNDIREIQEQDAEKEMNTSGKGKKFFARNNANNLNANEEVEPILENKGNSSDSEEIDIYKKNNSKLDNSSNEHLSGEEGDLNNKENNLMQKNMNVKKRNTYGMDLAEYENYRNKLIIEGGSKGVAGMIRSDEANKMSFSQAGGSKGKHAFSSSNAAEAAGLEKNLGLERKHSIENEKIQRRTSLITYKKSLNTLSQMGFSRNNIEEAGSARAKLINLKPDKNNKLNFEVIAENKNENSTNNKNEGDTRENNNTNPNNLNTKNKLNKLEKILLNIYDYFFPNVNQQTPSRNKLRNLRSTDEEQQQQADHLPELSELKHYDSDTDVTKMRKFVYEKLENVHKEIILKSKFKNAKNSFNNNSSNNYNSLGRVCSSSNNCNSDEILEGNLADEDEENSRENFYAAGGAGKYFSNDQIRNASFNLNDKSKYKNSNGKNKNSNSKTFNEETAENKSKESLNADENYDNNKGNLDSNINVNEKDSILNNYNNNKANALNGENKGITAEKALNINKKMSVKGQEFSKKSYITSVFYYDWAKDPNKYDVPYYFFTTPIMRLNENNAPTANNPLDEMKTMSFEDLMKIGKFNLMNIPQRTQRILKKSKVFVYDQFTAIPYIMTDLRNLDQNNTNNNNNNNNSNSKNSVFYPSIINNPNSNSPNNFNTNNNNNDLNAAKKTKLLVVVINDFFDCFTNHYELITNALGVFSASAERFKIINFNLPAQPFTLYNKKNIFNNVYFSRFLDRFLFSLMEKNVFDHTYSIVFMGFGNGGHIALNYVAANEKFFDFINSVIMLNSYCENDENIGKSMLEISKVIENSKNENMIDFFIKSITYNPLFLTQYNNININKKANFGFNLNATQLPSIDSKSARKANNVNDYSQHYQNNNVNEVNSGQNGDIVNKINHFLPMAGNQASQNNFNYGSYNAGKVNSVYNNQANYYPNNSNNNNANDKENISNLNDLNKLSFQRLFEKNAIGSPSEDLEIKLSYQGYSLITKGYFYNIPFNFQEIKTPIVAFHTSNNCFVPLTNLNNLFINCYDGNIDFSGLNNFAVKDPRSTMSPISSIDDFSEISPENKVRRKLVVCEGAHNLIKENPATLTMFLRNFFEYSFENVFGDQKN